MTLHALLMPVLALAVATASPTTKPTAETEWARYQQRFIPSDGRVIDTGNGGSSHSEGQSYGLLFAAAYGDRATFDRIWTWTRTHLARPGDRLFAWKWTPTAGVVDTNDAADADIVIAWALLRASERWHVPELRAEALALGEAILGKLYRVNGNQVYLLPGAQGFEHADGAIVNPSYCVFPAFEALGRASGRPEWKRLADAGSVLLRRARFGPHALPPDWLRLSEPLAPAPGWPPRFGFDAVRVPLYAIWGDRAEVLEPFRTLWTTSPARPGWIDLQDGSVAPFQAPAGMRAVAAATVAYPHLKSVTLPVLDDKADYYSASLFMLTRLMLRERGTP